MPCIQLRYGTGISLSRNVLRIVSISKGNPLRGLAPDPAVALALLQRGPWSGCERGSTGALMELWSEAHYALEAKARGVASLDALGQLEVRQAPPPPRSIDFAGAD